MPVTTDGRTTTTRARRAQIVTATIAVIAREGYGQASFARIAEHAGLSSTRLISYHFDGKDDLVAAVVATVLDDIGGSVGALVTAQATPRGMLRAYIEGVIGFAAEHPDHLVALLGVVTAAGPATGAGDGPGTHVHVERILREGLRTGDFRDLDPQVVALAVQRAVEGVALAVSAAPGPDAGRQADELATLFDLATRSSGRPRPAR